MIQLLTPSKVRSDSLEQEREQRARVRDLSSEEERLVRSINYLRKEEEDEKARIREDVADFRNKAQVEILGVDKQILEKKKEVEDIETRRKEALRPIEEIEQEARNRNEQSKQRVQILNDRQIEIDKQEARITEEWEAIDDRKQLLDEREEELNTRESKIKLAEDQLKESTNGLNERWAQFHIAVAEKEKELVDRENAVRAGEEANRIQLAEFAQLEKDYQQKDREIKDRYATLERAADEIRGLKK